MSKTTPPYCAFNDDLPLYPELTCEQSFSNCRGFTTQSMSSINQCFFVKPKSKPIYHQSPKYNQVTKRRKKWAKADAKIT